MYDRPLQAEQVALLAQVALGHVTRGESTGIQAPWLLNDESVVLECRWLARGDYIDMPISGPPTLAPRGRRLLAAAIAEHNDGVES